MAYFDTKEGSLEEAIKAAVKNQKINEASIYLDGHGEQDTGEGMKDFANLTKKLNLKFKNKLDRSGMGGTTVTGDAKSIEKMLQTMYGNDWKDMYKLKGQKFVDIDEKLDAVNPKAVKKKFDDRKDKDIDNDGDVDSTDKYLHKRRKAISKAVAKEENELNETNYIVTYSTKGKLFMKKIRAKSEDEAEDIFVKQFNKKSHAA